MTLEPTEQPVRWFIAQSDRPSGAGTYGWRVGVLQCAHVRDGHHPVLVGCQRDGFDVEVLFTFRDKRHARRFVTAIKAFHDARR